MSISLSNLSLRPVGPKRPWDTESDDESDSSSSSFDPNFHLTPSPSPSPAPAQVQVPSGSDSEPSVGFAPPPPPPQDSDSEPYIVIGDSSASPSSSPSPWPSSPSSSGFAIVGETTPPEITQRLHVLQEAYKDVTTGASGSAASPFPDILLDHATQQLSINALIASGMGSLVDLQRFSSDLTANPVIVGRDMVRSIRQIISDQDTALTQFNNALTNHLTEDINSGGIPLINHESGSAWGQKTQPITMPEWNSWNYTRIIMPSGNDPARWSYNGRQLSEAGNRIKGAPAGSVLMFHGTTDENLGGILDASSNDPMKLTGGGALGTGFYLTFSPNEAMGYACDRLGYHPRSKKGVVLEFIVKDADTIVEGPDYTRNSVYGMTSQIAMKRKATSLSLQRVHLFPRGKFPRLQISSNGNPAMGRCM